MTLEDDIGTVRHGLYGDRTRESALEALDRVKCSVTEHKPIAQPEDSRYWYSEWIKQAVMTGHWHGRYQDERDEAKALAVERNKLHAENAALKQKLEKCADDFAKFREDSYNAESREVPKETADERWFHISRLDTPDLRLALDEALTERAQLQVDVNELEDLLQRKTELNDVAMQRDQAHRDLEDAERTAEELRTELWREREQRNVKPRWDPRKQRFEHDSC